MPATMQVVVGTKRKADEFFEKAESAALSKEESHRLYEEAVKGYMSLTQIDAVRSRSRLSHEWGPFPPFVGRE